MPRSAKEQRVLVVQVHYATPGLLIDSLESLEREKYEHPNMSVLVVDNCSPDNAAMEIKREISRRGWNNWVSLIESELNGGYAYGNNLAVDYAHQNNIQADVLWLLNPDTVVQAGALTAALQEFCAEEKLIVGSRLTDVDGTHQKSIFPFPSILTELSAGFRLGVLDRLIERWQGAEESTQRWLAGASVLMDSHAYNELGKMDEGFFLYFEEVDFLKRAIDTGYCCTIAEGSKVVHMVGGATGISDLRGAQPRRPQYWFESRTRYFLKNHGVPYLVTCDLLFVSAYMVWLLRKSITDLKQVQNEPQNFLRDFVRYGILNPANWRRYH